ncbi:MAG: RseA family anti-sigma factor [Pseudomonadota bacterium]|jgi:hypothetical protein
MLDEHMAQKASAFVDNEMGLAEAQEYFRVIENREDVRSIVSRYYLIGEVLRTGQTPRGKLAERVAHQIKVEPAILAPVSVKPSYTLRRHIVTGALAASMAAMAVFVWRGLNGFAAFEDGFSMAPGAILAEAQIDPEMQVYLLAHSGTSHVAGAGTLMPYMRLVSHEQ